MLNRIGERLACCPLSLSNVGTPFLPVLDTIAVLLQALLLLGEVLVSVKDDHGVGLCRNCGTRGNLLLRVVGRHGNEIRLDNVGPVLTGAHGKKKSIQENAAAAEEEAGEEELAGKLKNLNFVTAQVWCGRKIQVREES